MREVHFFLQDERLLFVLEFPYFSCHFFQMSNKAEKENVEGSSDIELVQDPLYDEKSPEYRAMAKRVLWKFDLHVLPPLALVCTAPCH